jgi:hypothetical protein
MPDFKPYPGLFPTRILQLYLAKSPATLFVSGNGRSNGR